MSITAFEGNHEWFPLKARVNYVNPTNSTKVSSALLRLARRTPIKFLSAKLPTRKQKTRLELATITHLSKAIPDCDINVATWFPTALAVWISEKGKPFYFMQDFWEQMKTEYDRRLFKITLGLSMHFLTNSEYTKGIVLAVKPNAKVEIANPGVNTQTFYPRSNSKTLFAKPPKVMAIVRKPFFRGTDIALETLSQVNKMTPIHAILVGEQLERTKIDFPHSLYENIKNDDALARLYSASDLFLFTSRTEGFALPPLESMACGTPVVTTDCKGNRDYAKEGYNCLLANPEDKAQLRKHVLDALKNNELRNQLVQGGMETAKEFTWTKTANRFETAFEESLS